MCNYVTGLVPSMLCQNTSSKKCYDMLMQDSSDPPSSLIADFRMKIEDSTNRAVAAASLGQYEAKFFSNFGDAELPYLVELSSTTKSSTHLKSTSREGLLRQYVLVHSLGYSHDKLGALEQASCTSHHGKNRRCRLPKNVMYLLYHK